MTGPRSIFVPAILLGVLASTTGCVIHTHDSGVSAAHEQGYREGYYDREHNRYYHENAWHDCVDHDEHCH